MLIRQVENPRIKGSYEDIVTLTMTKENGDRKPTIFGGGMASRLDKAQRLMV